MNTYMIKYKEPFYKPDIKTVSETFISEENGFFPEDITAISSLENGGVYYGEDIEVLKVI